MGTISGTGIGAVCETDSDTGSDMDICVFGKTGSYTDKGSKNGETFTISSTGIGAGNGKTAIQERISRKQPFFTYNF